MFKNNTIKKRVMAVIETKIAEAQKRYDDEEVNLDREMEAEIKGVQIRVQAEKDAILEEAVNTILGKIL